MINGIFNRVYEFFYTWLFGTEQLYLTEQGAEFACILCTLLVIVFVVWLAILPLKAIISSIFRGW